VGRGRAKKLAVRQRFVALGGALVEFSAIVCR
jgi:hypothetical protein